jgi:putative endonuclease
MPDFWVYILLCDNDSLYVGYTTDLIKRYRSHVQGTAAKYTRSFQPYSLAQAWPIYGKKPQAMKIERFIKKMNKKEKLKIIADPFSLERVILEESDV